VNITKKKQTHRYRELVVINGAEGATQRLGSGCVCVLIGS